MLCSFSYEKSLNRCTKEVFFWQILFIERVDDGQGHAVK
jgi:hypothetical protein